MAKKSKKKNGSGSGSGSGSGGGHQHLKGTSGDDVLLGGSGNDKIDGKGGVTTKGTRYAPENILMIGDAPGDMKAARENDALFFPINPGHEEESWELFLSEAIGKFFDGTYAGDYEAQLIEKFDAMLPEVPPWKK